MVMMIQSLISKASSSKKSIVTRCYYFRVKYTSKYFYMPFFGLFWVFFFAFNAKEEIQVYPD